MYNHFQLTTFYICHFHFPFDGLQDPPNRYLSDLSTLNEGNEEMVDEISTCSTTKRGRSTRGQKNRKKIDKHMQFFLANGGSCSYDDKTKGDIKVPFQYSHIEKEWIPNELPPINIDFCVNERIYRIAPSSLHGLGIFSMDGIKVCYNKVVKLFKYVGPCYNYNDWMWIV